MPHDFASELWQYLADLGVPDLLPVPDPLRAALEEEHGEGSVDYWDAVGALADEDAAEFREMMVAAGVDLLRRGWSSDRARQAVIMAYSSTPAGDSRKRRLEFEQRMSRVRS